MLDVKTRAGSNLPQAMPLTQTEIDQIDWRERREHHVGKLWKYYVRKGGASGVLPHEWPLGV
jgi:hypothetical protein